ncbi:hypothetical protein [Montanilutibacter psychrotolerans]|uniref:Uncharacterized protein n=1 Tax=Montanilutibacter psychrotolerans TaxID=1327343 RepID=A0A3M8SZS7_9GAMM|nr:hypothetical protein [Lysobacter psychrotolerans]RNF86205.1 hypothetical protein EER27_01930 [Lysobacter psychrotolerans]
MALELEFRRISLQPGCLGNERMRVGADGALDYSQNLAECVPGQQWNSQWQHLGQLGADELSRLSGAVLDSGLLELEQISVDESVEGGSREELDLRFGDDSWHFVVQNTRPPAFVSVTRVIRQIVADRQFRPN